MKIYDIIDKIDDRFYSVVPSWFYRLWHSIFNFSSHKYAIKRFFQRLFRGWDDSDTWSLDSTFFRWLAPRLQRFQELNMCYPGDKRYPTFEAWDNELQYRCWQLKQIIVYEWNEWEFPYQEYVEDEHIDEHFKCDKEYVNSKAYYRCKQDFMIWYCDCLGHLWW